MQEIGAHNGRQIYWLDFEDFSNQLLNDVILMIYGGVKRWKSIRLINRHEK